MSSTEFKHSKGAPPKMSKQKREALFLEYAKVVKFERLRAASAWPAPGMHISSVRTGITDHIEEYFEETGRLPQGKKNVRKRGYGGGTYEAEFPLVFRWAGTGYMYLVSW